MPRRSRRSNASCQYPRDRVAHQLASILFLDRRYAEAWPCSIALRPSIPRILRCTTRTCSPRRPRRRNACRAGRELFLRFKADESAQAIHGAARLLKPEYTTSAVDSRTRDRAAAASVGTARSRRDPRIAALALTGLALAPLASFQAPNPSSPSTSAKASADKQASLSRRHRRGQAFAFVHNSGRRGRKWLPETMGSGWCSSMRMARLGRPALHQRRDWPARARDASGGGRSVSALSRTTTKARGSRTSRPAADSTWSLRIGAAAGDYDNDGRTDVYVTSLDGDRLYHNEGAGSSATCRRRRASPTPASAQRGVGRLRQGWPARSLRGQLRAVDPANRSAMHAGRRHEIVLHARVVPGHSVDALSEPGRRAVRGREPKRPASPIPPANRWRLDPRLRH